MCDGKHVDFWFRIFPKIKHRVTWCFTKDLRFDMNASTRLLSASYSNLTPGQNICSFFLVACWMFVNGEILAIFYWHFSTFALFQTCLANVGDESIANSYNLQWKPFWNWCTNKRNRLTFSAAAMTAREFSEIPFWFKRIIFSANIHSKLFFFRQMLIVSNKNRSTAVNPIA